MALHIGGISSGTDYAGMIQQLMDVRRLPIDKKEKEKTELDYDLGAWSEVNSQAQALTDILDDLRGSALWGSLKASSSLETVATATAGVTAVEQDYTLVVSNIAAAMSVSSDTVDTSSDLITNGYASENDQFTIEGATITIEAGETLVTLAGKINSAQDSMTAGSEVQASIVDNHLVLTRENTGTGTINVSDTVGSVLEDIGLTNLGALKNIDVVGANAAFSVNGIDITRTSNTGLDDVVTGLTLNLVGAGTTVLDVHPDRETIKETVLDFIEKYNSLASQVADYSKIEFGSSSSLASKGELYGDSLIDSIRRNIRSHATAKSSSLDDTNAAYTYQGDAGVMDSLSAIGIWTSGQNNELTMIDEERFDELLETEFDNMEQLFRGVYDETEIAFVGGVGSEFYKYLNNVSESLTGDIDQRVEALTKKYDDISDDIIEMTGALGDYEQKLWNQFTRMEDSLARMNSQLDYLKQAFRTG